MCGAMSRTLASGSARAASFRARLASASASSCSLLGFRFFPLPRGCCNALAPAQQSLILINQGGQDGLEAEIELRHLHAQQSVYSDLCLDGCVKIATVSR